MKNRLPVVLSATALVVAVVGVTPVGQATSTAIQTHYARNASFLRGAAPSIKAGKNRIPRANKAGKLDRSWGVVGAAPTGPTDWIVVHSNGTILRQSGGWTVTKTGTGGYRVEHPSLIESQMGVADAAFREPGGRPTPSFVVTFANDNTGFNVSTYNAASAPTDLGFSLIMTRP
jgi:hypothetical protein